jgi:hypothetical protein
MRCEIVDISKCPREGDFYDVSDVFAGTDFEYCDLEQGHWIWSIGRRLSDNKILAGVTRYFYQHPDFECVWLRQPRGATNGEAKQDNVARAKLRKPLVKALDRLFAAYGKITQKEFDGGFNYPVHN